MQFIVIDSPVLLNLHSVLFYVFVSLGYFDLIIRVLPNFFSISEGLLYESTTLEIRLRKPLVANDEVASRTSKVCVTAYGRVRSFRLEKPWA
jgi:hypothetical protein